MIAFENSAGIAKNLDQQLRASLDIKFINAATPAHALVQLDAHHVRASTCRCRKFTPGKMTAAPASHAGRGESKKRYL